MLRQIGSQFEEFPFHADDSAQNRGAEICVDNEGVGNPV
jgi:hypothetical protein